MLQVRKHMLLGAKLFVESFLLLSKQLSTVKKIRDLKNFGRQAIIFFKFIYKLHIFINSGIFIQDVHIVVQISISISTSIYRLVEIFKILSQPSKICSTLLVAKVTPTVPQDIRGTWIKLSLSHWPIFPILLSHKLVPVSLETPFCSPVL